MSDPFDSSEAPPFVVRGPNPLVVPLLVLLAMGAWRFTVECGIGILIVVLAVSQGADVQAIATNPEHLLRADVLAIGTTIQLVGMVLVIASVLRFVEFPVRDSLVGKPARVGMMAIAALSGATVGFFPGWINEQLQALMPEGAQLAMQEQIVEALTGGPLLGRVLMIGSVVIIAPIFEELAFRGGLWAAFERAIHYALGGGEERRRTAELTAFVLTSLAFAAYHLDPLHVISLLPTAFLLGWLRLTSRSVWPGVAAHFVNNGLAAGLAHVADGDPSEGLPFSLALVSIVVTLAFCAGAWTLRDRENA